MWPSFICTCTHHSVWRIFFSKSVSISTDNTKQCKFRNIFLTSFWIMFSWNERCDDLLSGCIYYVEVYDKDRSICFTANRNFLPEACRRFIYSHHFILFYVKTVGLYQKETNQHHWLELSNCCKLTYQNKFFERQFSISSHFTWAWWQHIRLCKCSKITLNIILSQADIARELLKSVKITSQRHVKILKKMSS